MTCATGCSRGLLIWEDTIIQQPRFHHRNFPSDQGLNDVISPPECPSSWGSHFQKFRDFGSGACSAEHVWLVEHFTSSILKHLQNRMFCVHVLQDISVDSQKNANVRWTDSVVCTHAQKLWVKTAVTFYYICIIIYLTSHSEWKKQKTSNWGNLSSSLKSSWDETFQVLSVETLLLM